MLLKALFVLAAVLPLSAQAWDLRLETPFLKGQSLPPSKIASTGQRLGGALETGHGVIFNVNHRLIRVGPVLKLEWGAELSHWQADGGFLQGDGMSSAQLRQTGLGLGLNAQFWVPFTGIAGELGVQERLQRYTFQAGGQRVTETLARPWLRAGLRYRLPFGPYVAASYQHVLTHKDPVQSDAMASALDYLRQQGSGQEFTWLWTLGVGVTF